LRRVLLADLTAPGRAKELYRQLAQKLGRSSR